ncbi:hypothetical protein [Dyella terrae]|uniref:hypothetical protein n=1 Tax=Dyella terrae TaxID=522259 RepID=UPI001EFC51A8|nr:hypothetical protein [Dyella terrae]
MRRFIGTMKPATQRVTRYLGGQRTLSGLNAINLRKLSEDMDRADNSFTQIGGGIDYMHEMAQYAAEANAE